MRYMDCGGKQSILVWHRRSGKDLTALHQTAKMALRRRAIYWHIFPTLEQGRRAIWEGFTKDGARIMEQVFPAPIRKSPRAFLPNGETVVELVNGSMWRLMGSDRLEVVGAGPAGVVVSEYALAKPGTFDLVRPMLRETEGWTVLISTPRGRNHLWRRYQSAMSDPAWFCDKKTIADTRAFDPEQTVREERASGMPEPLIQQEYFCSFDSVLAGSIFGDLILELEKRGGVQDFGHPTDDIVTTWDLGLSDATAIWFWRVNDAREVEVVDHYEASGKPLSHYVDLLRGKGYGYARHFLPHDANHRNLLTGGSVEMRIREELGSERVTVLPPASVIDGIESGRWVLQRANTRFHVRCATGEESGLETLREYRYAYDEEKKTLSRKELHNWASHTGSAWRCVGLAARSYESLTRPRPPPNIVPITKRPTLNDLFEAQREPDRRL